MTYDGRFLREAFDLVPSIGSGRRWYDFPYKFLRDASRSRLGRRLPHKVRAALFSGMNFLHPFNEHARNKVWSRDDWLHNVIVPADEEVSVSGLWVVELFPPSELQSLIRALDRNSWDTRRVSYGAGAANTEILERTRSGRGSIWWRVGSVVGDQGFLDPDAIRRKMPPYFSMVELSATHMGDGLTAIGAFFRMSEEGVNFLNREWHKPHEPKIVWNKGRPRAKDRMWTAYSQVQQARRLLHSEARSWLRGTVPGAFSRRGVPQPLIDLLLLEKFDPTRESATSEFSSALRALGIMDHSYHRKSEDFPALLLDEIEKDLAPDLDESTWTLWGSRQCVISSLSSLDTYGGPNARGVANCLSDSIGATLTFLALSRYLEAVQHRFSGLRDEARMRHGKFSARRLKKVRESFLSLSMDLSSAVRDVEAFHAASSRFHRIPKIMLEEATWLRDQANVSGDSRFPIDVTQRIMESQKETVAELAAEDKDYRDIISAVASLGATIDTFKLGRLALWVSLISLVVSMIALSLAEVKDDTLLSHLFEILAR